MYVSFHRSIKHYFLLDQGDFIVQFMDMAEEEMTKSMEGILLTCTAIRPRQVPPFWLLVWLLDLKGTLKPSKQYNEKQHYLNIIVLFFVIYIKKQ